MPRPNKSPQTISHLIDRLEAAREELLTIHRSLEEFEPIRKSVNGLVEDRCAAQTHSAHLKTIPALIVKEPLRRKPLGNRTASNAHSSDSANYSVRSACMGSIDAARRAGMNPAAVAQSPSTRVALTSATGS
jgi:hypothetical protein